MTWKRWQNWDHDFYGNGLEKYDSEVSNPFTNGLLR